MKSPRRTAVSREKAALPVDKRLEALRRFTAFLQEKGLKQTQQRLTILEVFLKTNRHICADELFRLVRERDPAIAFSTVYRTLHLLVQSGLAREQEFKQGRKFYEQVVGERGHHHHLICTSCGKIVEFRCPDEVERWQEEVARKFGFTLEGHTHELFGVCAACREKEAKA